ncbi:phosphatase PAP2 family protein [Arthrobacter sp. KFRI-F3372]|uniref:phosphatase PAP2 family protein n=1 Tax=Micrococcaceae TaxID=1268 RepID=UPI00277D7149|nr:MULTISPECIES: phosphatase PAP2 family protein [Micrococcaceae]MDP9989201.1 undecaprenyl-diphosphatase [Arthrobacter oryzae]MEE2523917.1 phosphatase PAP2 family protein [Pseudarthrobacter sp. J47]MEE2530346.1 phosphatase PAP2 family protein [Pseudarthrobacter sp. J75]WHP61105.1 phosphatase PAP2 family protein [Arthrobacter sp. KFRI-F3372]
MIKGTEEPASAGGIQGEVNHDRFVGAQDLTRWNGRTGHTLAAAVQRVSRALGPHSALILTLLAGAAIAITLTVIFAEVYESVVEADGVAGLDHPVLDTAKSLRSPALDTAVTAYTNIGGTVGMPILALTATIVLALRRKSWTPVILIIIAAAGSLLMTIAGKQLIGRTRPALSDAVPPYEHSASFPSGHSLNAIVIAGIITYLVILRLKTSRSRVTAILLAAVFAATMGLSRVYLGHHWLTDVIAAWALGAAWLALVITAHRLYLTARVRNHSNP